MDIGRLVRQGGIYLVPKLVAFALQFLLIPILTRVLAPEVFGAVALAWTVQNALAGLATFSIGTAVQRYFFEYRQESNKLASLIVSVQILLYAIFPVWLLIMAFACEPLARFASGNGHFAGIFWWAFVASYLNQIIGVYLIIFQNEENPTAFAWTNLAQAVLTCGATLFCVTVLKWSALGMILGGVIGAAFPCVVLTGIFIRKYAGQWQWGLLKENIAYGLSVSPKTGTSFINRFFDKYMLNNVLSLGMVGIYNVSQSLVNGVGMVANSIQSVFQPQWYKLVFDDKESGSRRAGELFFVFLYAMGAMIMAGMVLANPLLNIILAPNYHEAIGVFIVLLFGFAAQVFGMFVGVQFAYAKKAYLIFPLTIVGIVVNVLANIVLIPQLGLMGAAVAVVLSSYSSNVLMMIIAQKVHPIVYDWGKIIGVTFFLCAALVLGLLGAQQTSTLNAILKVVCLAGYFIWGNKIGIFAQLKGMKS